jgi:4-amino-4-deoxy-L-arabinose transferase-like glycosyltransferase|tara:strand:+ start:1521 stop:1790 length:270 start_codon:yes stop_codon:yes gene_type:complete
MFDPQLWFGVALTLAVVLLGYMAWDSMKNYVEGYVRRELLDHTRNLEVQIHENVERLERQHDRLMEDTDRNLRETEREIYEAMREHAGE